MRTPNQNATSERESDCESESDTFFQTDFQPETECEIFAYLPGRIELVELHAEVRGVCPGVDRETDLESGKRDSLHDAAPEVAKLGLSLIHI